MRILVLGAGAIGGYYGARLVHAGRDVTFLVRPARAARISATGLSIASPTAPLLTASAKTITQADDRQPYDAILLSCKSYDLESAIAAIKPAVGPRTIILPLLNGMRHLDVLDAEFGPARVLGGTCHISTTLDDDGTVRQMSPFDILTLGPRNPDHQAAARALSTELDGAGFEVRYSESGTSAMWDKWVLIATLAGMTCLMRANIGEIVATRGGEARISQLLDECCAVATAYGHAPKSQVVFFTRSALTDPMSQMSSSMLRDLQRGSRTEADHILGDLAARGAKAGVPTPLLDAAFAHLQAYQNRLTPT